MIFSPRNIIIGIIVLILAVAIPVTVRLAREQQQLKSKAAGPGVCVTNPVTNPAAPAGYTWLADCSRSCDPSKVPSDCPINPDIPVSAGTATNWCYGFEDGAKCMKLVGGTVATAPSGTITNIQPNPAPRSGSGWGTVSISYRASVPSKLWYRSSTCAPTPNCGGDNLGWILMQNNEPGLPGATATWNPPSDFQQGLSTGILLTDANNVHLDTKVVGFEAAPTASAPTASAPPPPGGNVGVGGVNVGTCDSITVNGNDYRNTDLAVGTTYQVAITMKNTQVETTQTDWNNNYYLLYTGSSASQLGLSSQKINVSKTKVGVNDSEIFRLSMTPTAVSVGDPNSGGGFQFYWEMRNDKDQPFLTGSGQCKPNFVVKTAAPPGGAPTPGGACPEGRAAGFIDGADRKYLCMPVGTIGCLGPDNTNVPPVNGVPAKDLTCPTTSQTCLACKTDFTNVPFSFGQCGICRNDRLTKEQDPNCEDSSASRDTGTCTTSHTITFTSSTGSNISEKFTDRCIMDDNNNPTCVQATKPRDCIVCYGSDCDIQRPQWCTDSTKPFCEQTQPNRGLCVATAASPSPIVSPSPSVAPSPQPVKNTLCFAFGEGDAGKTAVDAITTADAATFCKTVASGGKVDNILVFNYAGDPDTTTFKGYTFKDQTPGIKTFFVKFIGLQDGVTKVTETKQKSITFKPNPQITNVSCTTTSTGPGTQITMTGKFFGSQGNATIKVANQDAVIKNWDDTNNKIEAQIDQRLDGKNSVSVAFDSGITITPTQGCTVNNTTVAYKVIYQCRAAGTTTISNADVKVFEGIAASTQNVTTPSPLLQQKVNFDKDGVPTNLAAKLEKNKNYELITKAPTALAKRIDFNSGSGGTTTLNNGDPVILLQGDIAPLNAPDGVINAFDKSELIRQWSLITDVARTGDLNGDLRINSVDYACMRQNINAGDEKFGFITAPIIPAGT